MRWWIALGATMAVAGCGGGGGAGGGGSDAPPLPTAPAVGVPAVTALGSRGATLALAPLPSGGEWLLALVSSSASGSATVVTVNDGAAELPQLAALPVGRLRRDRAAAGDGRNQGGRGRAVVGDQRDFWLGGIGFSTTVTATLRRLGTHCWLYVDDSTPAGALTDEQLADLADVFDRQIYARNAAAFGTPADPDRNGVVTCLFTPYVNQRGYGVFYPGDLSSLSGDGIDLLYLLVPEPGGGRPYETLRPGLLATLAHELQHLINYSHKAGPAGLFGGEESWLNEGLSFLAEDLNGYLDSPGGSPENVAAYLASPERYTLLERTGDYNDGQAGAAYLFVRYLVDRYGEGLLASLVDSDTTGPANVAAATGASFDSLQNDWTAALWLTAFGLSSDPRYRLSGFDLTATYSGPLTIAGPLATAVPIGGANPNFRVRLARGGTRFLRLTGPPAGGQTLRLSSTDETVRAILIRLPPAG
ncbi:MAG: hypothetical protein IT204_04525 [Fimbriimonadaceae bacterium]|nr:hypothetical protein [Fimbriimonadaceae bacterium]